MKNDIGKKIVSTAILSWSSLLGLLALVNLQACAPATIRTVAAVPASSITSSSPQVALPPRLQEPQAKPPAVEPPLKEEPLREKRPPPQVRSKEIAPRPAPLPAPGREVPPPLPEDNSLIAKITPRTPPQRAASLRLTEEGKRLLDAGDYDRALARLEKTIAIDSTNAYGYFYLGKAHHLLGRYQESLNFLEVAESLFGKESYWLAEVFALKGENFRALGLPERANTSYTQALRLNSGNRVAFEGLSRVKEEAPAPQR